MIHDCLPFSFKDKAGAANKIVFDSDSEEEELEDQSRGAPTEREEEEAAPVEKSSPDDSVSLPLMH